MVALVAICLLLIQLPDSIRCSSPMPKIFVDVDSIQMIDPLKRGFEIILKSGFVSHYLDPVRMPTIYLSIIPLNPKLPSHRLMYYREEVNYVAQGIMKVQGLEPKSWYYACLEFENVIRVQNKGNTSTSCRMVRTLDDYGMKGDTFVKDIQLVVADHDSLTFKLSMDVNFTVQIIAYLELGSCPAQIHILHQPISMLLRFRDLSPGSSYGKLCFLYLPMAQRTAHTMLGRSIHYTKTECHFDYLRTEEAPIVISDTGRMRMQRDGVSRAQHQRSRCGDIMDLSRVNIYLAVLVVALCRDKIYSL